MSKTHFNTAVWVLSLSLAGAVPAQEAAHDTKPDSAAAADTPENCFNITRAKDIHVLTDEHVYVRTIGNHQYLLTMARQCENLQRSYRSGEVLFQPYGQRVCPNDGSHLIYRWSGREAVCPILSIDAVADIKEARARADGEEARVEIREVPLPPD
jgi:Family of unknown function (DUF6491)